QPHRAGARGRHTAQRAGAGAAGAAAGGRRIGRSTLDRQRRARRGRGSPASTGLEIHRGDGMSSDILSGITVVEGSAFVAAPLGGMTLAQNGADVIRFDQIGGGLDYRRWPLAPSGESLFWAGLNKGKRSIQVDLRSEEG